MFTLKYETPNAWVQAVMQDFDTFLADHAAAEKKASSMAMSMVAHYPDKPDLISAMIDLAIEELTHYREVFKLMRERDITPLSDEKDPYINQLRKHTRNGRVEYLVDRLIIAAIVEARGCERFGLIADALEPGPLKKFYEIITRSEAKHHELFINIAYQYFDKALVDTRLDELLDIEANIVKNLVIRPYLH